MGVVIVNGVRVKATWPEVIDPSQIAELRLRASQVRDRLRIGTKQENRLSVSLGRTVGVAPEKSSAPALHSARLQWPPGRSGVP